MPVYPVGDLRPVDQQGAFLLPQLRAARWSISTVRFGESMSSRNLSSVLAAGYAFLPDLASAWISSLPWVSALRPGIAACPRLVRERLVASLNPGSFSARVLRPGAAAFRLVRSGVWASASVPSLASVGLSWARKLSSRLKLVERSSRRDAEMAATSR